MTSAAAPGTGRRASLGAAAVLVGFLLLAPPLYVLGSFALLTLFARPRSLREVFWLAAAGAGTVAAFTGPADLGYQLLRVSGVAVAIGFVGLSWRARGPVFPRAMLAVGLAGLAVIGYAIWRGLTYPGVESAFTEMLRASYRSLVEAGGTDPSTRRDLEEFVRPFLERAPTIGRLMPGVLALEALAGSVLAWAWHHRISSTPFGSPPARFRDFRFNDHLVWGAILTLGLLLTPAPAPVPAIAASLMVIWVGLYAMRGLAVLATLFGPSPIAFKVFAVAFALLLLPVTLGACLAVGLADTWLDIRARIPPPVSPTGSP
jgi:hypothetical protein